MRVRNGNWRRLALAIVATCLVLGATSATAGINDKEKRVRHRIHTGVQDGSLTKGETKHLLREQKRIEHKEQRFRHNDGQLGPRERIELNRDIHRSQHHVRRAKNNNRTP